MKKPRVKRGAFSLTMEDGSPRPSRWKLYSLRLPRFGSGYGFNHIARIQTKAASEAAEKLIPDNKVRPQRLKPNSKKCTYRSAGSAAPPKKTYNTAFFRSQFSRRPTFPTSSLPRCNTCDKECPTPGYPPGWFASDSQSYAAPPDR